MRRIMMAGLAWAVSAVAQAQGVSIAPWSEAVVSVRDLAGASSLFRKVGKWRDEAQGRMEPAELAFYGLPKTTRGSYRLVCPPSSATGCIRFVRFDGAHQRPIRLAARPWDSGGIFSIMIRSNNVQALFDAAIAQGWWAESEPIRFDFGGSKLRNVVLTGPHGINIAVYERLDPPFTAFPVGAMSEGFNSMRMVRDHKTALDFYTRGLGFATLFNADYLDDKPTPSNFSIPHNFVQTIPRRAAVVYPVAGETGRIELMQLAGFTGKDVSGYASPPNLGILSVRFPVRGLANYTAQLASRGISPAYQASALKIAGIVNVSIIAVRYPYGNLKEFYETAVKKAADGLPSGP